MKIYILSLASDAERRARLVAQLQALGLDFEIFNAVDGRQGLPEEHRGLVDFERAASRLGRKLGTGEAACAISHTLIYEKIIAEGHAFTAVLEDDVYLDHNFAQLIKCGAHTRYDLLLLNHKFSHVWRFSEWPLFGHFKTYRLLLPCWMTAAYIVSQRGAEYLLQHSRPVNHTADWPGDITEIGARVCVPMLVQHPDEAKHLSNLACERHKVIDNLRFFKAPYWRRWVKKRLSTRIA